MICSFRGYTLKYEIYSFRDYKRIIFELSTSRSLSVFFSINTSESPPTLLLTRILMACTELLVNRRCLRPPELNLPHPH
uniref:Uncharacterized protein n=1 Tax=Brassica oleracea TaxID=3712 RepID=A0A3P6E0I7_BRAOL|nr:unnamed protein product [Brassica oleracea]